MAASRKSPFIGFAPVPVTVIDATRLPQTVYNQPTVPTPAYDGKFKIPKSTQPNVQIR